MMATGQLLAAANTTKQRAASAGTSGRPLTGPPAQRLPSPQRSATPPPVPTDHASVKAACEQFWSAIRSGDETLLNSRFHRDTLYKEWPASDPVYKAMDKDEWLAE